MSKVELSIQEYDMLKEELAMYKEIVDSLTTPHIDDWSLDWYKDHRDSILSIETSRFDETLSKKSKTFLISKVKRNIEEFLSENGIEGDLTMSGIRVSLGSLKYKEEEE